MFSALAPHRRRLLHPACQLQGRQAGPEPGAPSLIVLKCGQSGRGNGSLATVGGDMTHAAPRQPVVREQPRHEWQPRRSLGWMCWLGEKTPVSRQFTFECGEPGARRVPGLCRAQTTSYADSADSADSAKTGVKP